MSTNRQLLELRRRDANREALQNDDIRQGVSSLVGSLADRVIGPQDNLSLTKKTDNRVLLLAGDRGGLVITQPYTTIQGVPGARLTGRVDVQCGDGYVHFIGVTFRATPESDNADTLVNISADSRVLFSQCNFEKDPTCPLTADFITIEAGGQAVFTNCIFSPEQTGVAGFTINNAGALADVIATNCARRTGWPHNNVTTSGEII